MSSFVNKVIIGIVLSVSDLELSFFLLSAHSVVILGALRMWVYGVIEFEAMKTRNNIYYRFFKKEL